MRKIPLLLLLVILVRAPCLAQSNMTDSVTITTYYPAPYGVYKNMRLYPSQQPSVTSGANQPGTMYFNGTDSQIYVYTNTTPRKWQPVGGIADFLVGSHHTKAACTNTIVGGTPGMVIDSDVSFPLCRFNANSCPSGWQAYKNFTTIGIQVTKTSRDCNSVEDSCEHACAMTCGTYTWTARAWGDIPIVIPTVRAAMADYAHNGTQYCGCRCDIGTCAIQPTDVVTQIGCY